MQCTRCRHTWACVQAIVACAPTTARRRGRRARAPSRRSAPACSRRSTAAEDLLRLGLSQEQHPRELVASKGEGKVSTGCKCTVGSSCASGRACLTRAWEDAARTGAGARAKVGRCMAGWQSWHWAQAEAYQRRPIVRDCTRSAPCTRAPLLWLPLKVSADVARRCRTRCDKRHSGVNCKLVQMIDAVCGARCRAHEKRLLHLASKQLVHPGCRRACSTAWTGRRAPE